MSPTIFRVLNVGLMAVIFAFLLAAIWLWSAQWLLTAGVVSLIWWALDAITEQQAQDHIDQPEAVTRHLREELDAYKVQLDAYKVQLNEYQDK